MRTSRLLINGIPNLLIYCLVLLSCTSVEETDYYPSADVDTRLVVNPTTLSFDAKAQESVMNVSSNTNWTVSSDASWCKVVTTSGVGNAVISIKTDNNVSAEQRTCNITIGNDDKTVVINVTQNGGSLPNVTISDITDITRNSAKVKGGFTSDFSIRECGLLLGSSASPQTDGTKIPMDEFWSNGIMDAVVNNLKSGTLYYICAYVTDELGTAYSNVVSFKTSGETPGEYDNPTPSI